ncbi:MAG: 2OG-Fe(II) oxygenase [Proteobacteria bacterium]|nr:2OG-Fe(II) oxygenase [Pseudomonadota bacterium]
MEWENKVFVVDDILTKKQQEDLKRILLSSQFPWHFIPDVTGGGSRDGRPAFQNKLIYDGKVNVGGKALSLLQQLIDNSLSKLYEELNVKANYELFRVVAILQMPLANLGGSRRDAHHIDFKKKHLNILYYVFDADGDTVIFENMYHPNDIKAPEPNELKVKKKVTPKQGRVVIFDGYHWHTGTQPQKGIRCVININVYQK